MVVLKRAVFVAVVAMLAACKPDLGSRESQITGPRLLAMRATPAEAAQGDPVTYDALVVDPTGEIQPSIDYAYCKLRKPLDDPDTVDFGCLAASGDGIVEIGSGTSVGGTMPTDACRNFGPDVPSPQPGQPPGRPIDPDPTGGYYQPLRLLFGSEIDVGESRISCGVAGASLADSATFRAQYHLNENPSVLDVSSDLAGSLSDDPTAPTTLAPGAYVTLTASWPTCPTSDTCGDGVCGADESETSCPSDCTNPVGCAGAERYVLYDPLGHQIVIARETMSAAWFVTTGSLDSDGTGRDGTDLTTSTSDGLTLPTTAGPVHGWVVLQDDRGGVGWRRFEIAVGP